MKHTICAKLLAKPPLAVLALTLLAGVLSAQAPKTQALQMALGSNAKQMTQYQWKQRTTIIRNGSVAAVKIDEVRFDAGGQMQRFTISQPEEKKMGPLRARKAAEIKDDVQEVMRLAARYASPQELVRAIQKGEIWEGQGSLRVQSRYLILPMDEMTMMVNGANYLPVRADFKSQHDGKPVTIAIDYQQLPGGPSMPARMTVQITEDNVVVNVESFDFTRLASFNVP